MYQQISVIGRIGKGMEVTHTKNGKVIGKFSVAVTEKWNQNGEKMEKTEWFNCQMFGDRCEKLAQYVRKGDMIHVTGKMSSNEYNEKTYWNLSVNQLTLLPNKSNNSGDNSGSNQVPASTPNLDDVPF